MKAILYTSYSTQIKELADLTNPNNEKYAKRHGYDFRADNILWDGGKASVPGLETILELLDTYDLVLSHGADVLIMNHRIKINSVLLPNDNVVVAREMIGWWPINNDVMIWRNTQQTRWLLRRLIDAYPEWIQYGFLWQTYLWNLLQDDIMPSDTVRLVHPKVMNAVHPDGPARWQLGDWIIHFMAYTLREKIIYAQKYLPLAGDPIFRALTNPPN